MAREFADRGAHVLCALPGEDFSTISGRNLDAERKFKHHVVSERVKIAMSRSSEGAIAQSKANENYMDEVARKYAKAPFVEKQEPADVFEQISFSFPLGGRFS